MTANVTVTDLFAGAGGSSTGMVAVPGVRIRMAANHWKLAIAVHNQNHPDTDHAPVDLHEEDPRFFPRTDILWASPECTKWSQAAGNAPRPAIEEGLFQDPLSDEAARRSRLLMFDVLKFAEHHRYRAMIIENVIDIAVKAEYRLAWKVWQQQLRNLGYDYRVVSLNSMHAQHLGAPAPQSRDRLYVVCWRRGERVPDIDKVMRPRAWCARCDRVIESRQAFKPGRTVGKYRQQYVYVCSTCGDQVEPAWLPAAAAIDWSIPGTRIGDRPIKDFYNKKGTYLGRGHLAPKTTARIAAGIARYWRPLTVEAAGNQYDAADPRHRRHGDPNGYYRAWPVADVMRTLHTTESKALLIPVEGRDGKDARPAGLIGRTQTTRLETAVVTPFIAELRGGSSDARSVTDPAATFTASGNHHALITRHYGDGGSNPARHTTTPDEPMRTLTANAGNMSLLTPYYGTAGQSKPATDPIGTLTTRDRYGLVTPAGGTWNDAATSTDEALRTLTTRDAYALLTRHFSSKGDGAEMTTPIWEAMRTLTTKGHQSVVTPGDLAAAEAQVEDCLFRMLYPHEVAAGMAFPADYDWHVLNEKGKPPSNADLVKMAGNAVTPPAARDLMAAVVESLTREDVAA